MRGTACVCLCLKLGEDLFPLKQQAIDFCPNLQNAALYSNDILLCCWLQHPNLAGSTECHLFCSVKRQKRAKHNKQTIEVLDSF